MHGIVGFLRIIDKNNLNFVTKNENYIEFDTEDLRNFHKYYFNYFFEQYNMSKKIKDINKSSFEFLKSNIENSDNENKKIIKEKLKNLENSIRYENSKIKDFDSKTHSEIKSLCEHLKNATSKQEFEEIWNKIICCFEKDEINKKLTLNKIRSELSKTYFGQNSFLQRTRAQWKYEEQENLIYRDYISNIVEFGFIYDVLNDKYTLEEIKKYVSNILTNGNLTAGFINIYTKITRCLNENKSLEYIKEILNKEFNFDCCCCEKAVGMTSNYSEGYFLPLAISAEASKNFFWNQNVKMPICDMCKLILFCIPAGVTHISKIEKTYDSISKSYKYTSKAIFSFINYDTTISNLYKTNCNFNNNSKIESFCKNPYPEMLLDIVSHQDKLSSFQLQNIFVVEFDADLDKQISRIEYFNIKKYVANFFVSNHKNMLYKINDYLYRVQMVDYILKNKSLNILINNRLRDASRNNSNSQDSFWATKIQLILNLLKKEEKSLDILKNDKKLYVIYNLGVQINEELKHRGEDNKLNGYTYKMLNAIKAGNKKEFMDTLIRLHLMIGKDISPIFIETMQKSGLDFESIGHSFLAGLISGKYEYDNDSEENN